MRENTGWALVAAAIVAAAISSCGDDDDSRPDGAAGASGRGGAAGADSGGGDTPLDRGAPRDALVDRDAGGQLDAAADVSVEVGRFDAVPGDAADTNIADISIDRVDADASSTTDAQDGDAPESDGRDVGSTDGATDGGDAASDGGQDADGGATDVFGAPDAPDAPDATPDAPEADIGGDAGDVADAPSCNDGSAATFDFYSPLYGCGHVFDANPGDDDAWITYDAGFHVDVATGLGWVFPSGGRSAAASATLCDGLGVLTLTDWRMPTIDEARSLAAGCAPTAPGGSCPIDDPGCLAQSCGTGSPACDSCTASGGPNAGQYCKVDAVCTFFHTSSVCSDCNDAGANDWIYIPINGNFYAMASVAAIPTACVSIVPGGVPASDGG